MCGIFDTVNGKPLEDHVLPARLNPNRLETEPPKDA